MLEVSPATYDDDPLRLAIPLQNYVSRLPLNEFEDDDWRTLHNDLACFLADLLIRRDGAAWTVKDDPESPLGYSYLLEVTGRDGTAHTLDPYDVVREEFAHLPIEIFRMIANAEVVTGLQRLQPDV